MNNEIIKEPINNGIDGICCTCRYDEEIETDCKEQEDGIHCEHWWNGKEYYMKPQLTKIEALDVITLCSTA